MFESSLSQLEKLGQLIGLIIIFVIVYFLGRLIRKQALEKK